LCATEKTGGRRKPSILCHMGVWTEMQLVARKLMTRNKAKNRQSKKKQWLKPGDSSAKPGTKSRE
jgi:hypothetical protein